MTLASKISRAGNGDKLQQDQKLRILLAPEGSNGVHVLSNHSFDVRGRAVPASDPHNTRNRIGDLAALLEVRVLGYDGEAMLQRKTPDRLISGAVKPYRSDVR